MTNREKLNKARIERVGEIRFNRYGTPMKIIDYKSFKSVVVEFQDEYKHRKVVNYGDFNNGKVSNPYDKTVCGIGYLGEGQYGAGENNKRMYSVWQDIIRRCYFTDPNNQNGYLGCSMVEEWHNFQNFAKWYCENSYIVDGEKLHIDKDLLYFDNKIYGPDTCLLIPERINYLIIRHAPQRGKYPIGVRKHRKSLSFEARCMTHNGKESIGFFNTPDEAFMAYKKRKEEFIKEVANEYKNKIPDKVYHALLKYEVIDDTKLIKG